MTRRAVVAGMIGTFPVGGVAWDYGQYVLGLEQLGFEVFYLEDNGCWGYDADVGSYEPTGAHGARFLAGCLAAMGAACRDRWHLRAADGSTYGAAAEEVAAAIADADVFLNVSGATALRPEHEACGRTVFIDTDPGWNHLVVLPRGDQSYRRHDVFFSYATRIGRPGCALPTLDIDWRPTLPPVVLDRWSPEPPGSTWTTVLTWDNYREPITAGSASYGSKVEEFAKVLDLPRQVAARFELAVGGADPPIATFQAHGWGVVDGPSASRTAEAYRAYVQRSRGEVSVAKQVFAATGSGWFSCRSTCYLAAGRPVVVQDTGFSAAIPPGEGLLAFTTAAEAVAAVHAVEADHAGHAEAARRRAEETFAAGVVLGRLLDEAGVA